LKKIDEEKTDISSKAKLGIETPPNN